MSKIIAHRGLNKKAPENTIPAFIKAVEVGVDGIETDVHLTLDGKLAVCHDYDINRMSNGTGQVAEMTLDEIRKFDFSQGFKEIKDIKLPTLEEVLDVVKGLEIINIEVKSPKNKRKDIVKKTIDVVRDFGLINKVIISSFDHDLLVQSKDIDNRIKTGILYSIGHENIRQLRSDYIEYAKSIKADALHPSANFVDNEEYIDKAHKNNINVNTWTVNRKYQIMALNEWLCDGIITDVGDEALGIIK